MKRRVHLAGWQRIAWALDEDLRWARQALEGEVEFTGLAAAEIVLAAWWPALEALGPAALAGKVVWCFADNPPAFYLTRPGFAAVAGRVDRWIARSREARHQFEALGLPVDQVPYCVDPEVFRPLPEREAIRQELGLPAEAFVIGNFHRDSEGADLSRPKVQKGADILFEIARDLHRSLPQTVVLLAGPRRHWLVRRLAEAGIPYRFAGTEPGEDDDYARNILDRPALNRLYQALDVCVISSRWEGGPYSVLESLLAGRPVISTPVGMTRDLLSAEDRFRTVPEAVRRLSERAARPDENRAAVREKVLSAHNGEVLRGRLKDLLASAPSVTISALGQVRSGLATLRARVRPPVWPTGHPEVLAVASRREQGAAEGTFYEADGPDADALAASARGIREALTR